MAEKLRHPRGTFDLLPADTAKWQVVERAARDVAARYGYAEIRTPVFEHTELFHRGVGETTDIVSKETYTFEDRGGRSLTLRPEGTAPVVRALLQHGLLSQEGATAKLYYLSMPMFRYERPQAGRFHQHHQFGAESFGVASPEQDAELLLLQLDFFESVGLRELSLQVNSLGDGESKARYAQALRRFFADRRDKLSDDSQRRLETNPLRILDSKDPRDIEQSADAPANVEFLSEHSRQHFDALCRLLRGANVTFERSPNLVRGIDYYTETLWEWTAAGLGAHNVVGGGGRYDNLVETLGGRPTPGVGFGTGIERLLLALEAQGRTPQLLARPLVWLAAAGDAARPMAFKLSHDLRRAGFAADMDHAGRSLKAQLKLADRRAAAVTLVLGDDELANETVQLKEMRTGEQQQVPQRELVAALGRLLPTA